MLLVAFTVVALGAAVLALRARPPRLVAMLGRTGGDAVRSALPARRALAPRRAPDRMMQYRGVAAFLAGRQGIVT
jgi:hypothetical protein